MVKELLSRIKCVRACVRLYETMQSANYVRLRRFYMVT
jgi:hypothetical protein